MGARPWGELILCRVACCGCWKRGVWEKCFEKGEKDPCSWGWGEIALFTKFGECVNTFPSFLFCLCKGYLWILGGWKRTIGLAWVRILWFRGTDGLALFRWDSCEFGGDVCSLVMNIRFLPFIAWGSIDLWLLGDGDWFRTFDASWKMAILPGMLEFI